MCRRGRWSSALPRLSFYLNHGQLDTQKCERLARKIYAFFRATLNLKFETSVPVLLVDKEEIHKCVRRHRLHLRPQPNQKHQTWGTLATIPQKINTVTKCVRKGDEIEVVKKVEHVTYVGGEPYFYNGIHQIGGGSVAAIVILYGLPMVTMGSIMAHEMMHAWIRLQDWYHPLKSKVEEGICQLISHMWLESFTSNDQFTKSLREFAIFSIENVGGEDKDKEIYGDGFREAKRAVDEYGLETTLKHLARNGRFDPAPAKAPGCCCF